MTEGINIYRVTGQSANQLAAQSTTQSGAQSATQSASQITSQPAAQPATQSATRTTGHWEFRTAADSAQAAFIWGLGTSAWEVRQRYIQERANDNPYGPARGIDVHWVLNTNDNQPSEPRLDTSPEDLMAGYYAILSERSGRR
jgi:hypothetical protein